MQYLFLERSLGQHGSAGVLAALAGCLAVFVMAPAWPQSDISGTATYREKIALPPDAIFEAILEDVSRAGARSEVLGRHRIESPGQPPIQFKIDYDPAAIKPGNRYAVRARITRNDQLMFTTDVFYPAFSGDEPTSPLELLLRMAPDKATARATFEFRYLPRLFAGNFANQVFDCLCKTP